MANSNRIVDTRCGLFREGREDAIMNARVARKIRKYSQRQFLEYVHMVKQWPFKARLRFAWHILKPARKR